MPRDVSALPLLQHFSAEPLATVKDTRQQCEPGMKPSGLWMSAFTGLEGDLTWEEWCRDEGFMLDRLACCTDIHLEPDARVLHIATDDGLRGFHDEFSVPIAPGLTSRVVDWKAVAR